MVETRFLADRMLGRLARMLRILGQDVEYVREGEARAIAERAVQEARTLLTRDTRLAERPRGPLFFVRSNYPFHQVREVVQAFSLPLEASFRFCVEDNGALEPVPLEAVADQVPAFVQAVQQSFFRCPRCGRAFWAGTHVAGMQRMIAALADAPLLGTTDPEAASAEDTLGPTSTLAPLVDLHQAFEVLFAEHRLALMEGDLERARQKLTRFSIWMRRHIQDENTLVFPVYRAHAPAGGYPKGERPEIFEHDHAQILARLDAAEAQLAALIARAPAGPERALACLELLDRERTLVDLCEHHDRRERSFLYPVLERVLEAPDKLALLEAMAGPQGP